MAIFINNAHVMTMDDKGTEYESANILIRGTKIEALGPNVSVPTGGEPVKEIDATGKLVMPGIINAHFHSVANLYKGQEARPLSVLILWVYHTEAAIPAGDMDPETTRHVNLVTTSLGAIEMLKRGVTAVHEDAHYLPTVTNAAVTGNVQAFVDSGLRATMSLTQYNAIEYDKYPFLKEMLPGDAREQMEQMAAGKSDAEILGNYRDYIDEWHNTADGRIHGAISISAPERVTTDLLLAASALSRECGVIFESHCQEAKYQRVLAEQRHNKSLIAYMDDLGVLDNRVHLNHVVWTDAKDIEILARTGTAVSHNIHCNLYYGSGLMPFRQMREAGVPVGIGVDEVDASGNINPWEAAKVALMVQHITDPDFERWVNARDMLWCLTRGGARGMGREHEVGMLAPGYEADLIVVDLNTPSFTPLVDLPTQLIMSDMGNSVVMTMVGGNIVMENGVVTTLDEEAINKSVIELASAMPPLGEMFELYPYAREVQRKAEQTDIGFDRTLHARFFPV